MPKPAIGNVACPCCDLEAEVRETDKGKPYIVCDDCGFQGFARGQGAVTMLRTKMKPIAAAAAVIEEVATMPAPAKKKPVAAKPAPKKSPPPKEPEQRKEAPPPKDDFGTWLGLGIGQ